MPLRRRELLILGGVASGAALAGGLVGALALQSRSGASALLSARFPDLSGRPRQLSEWLGQVLLCNFWATWCAPCRAEMPLLDALQRQYGANGVQVVGIAADNAAKVREYLREIRIGFTILVAEAAAIPLMRAAGNSAGALPFTAMLDREGRLRHRKLGAYTEPELQREVATLLR